MLFPFFFVAPIQVVVITVLLILEFGLAYISGLAAVVAFVVFQAVLANGLGKMRFVHKDA